LLILTPFALLMVLILFGRIFTMEFLRDGHLLMLLISTGSSCLLLASIGLIFSPAFARLVLLVDG
jgi:hypothetical protein